MSRTPKPRGNGIKCPHCSAELFDSRERFRDIFLMSPLKKRVECRCCGYTGVVSV